MMSDKIYFYDRFMRVTEVILAEDRKGFQMLTEANPGWGHTDIPDGLDFSEYDYAEYLEDIELRSDPRD